MQFERSSQFNIGRAPGTPLRSISDPGHPGVEQVCPKFPGLDSSKALACPLKPPGRRREIDQIWSSAKIWSMRMTNREPAR